MVNLWSLIESEAGIYLLDFNDWAIGEPIIEMSVCLLEFGMIKSDKFDYKVIESIING